MGRTIAITLGVIVIIGITWLTPRAPQTHAEAIRMAFVERGIAVQSITTTQPWPNALPFYAYGDQAMPYSAVATITLPSGSEITGIMVCRRSRQGCELTVPQFDLVSIALMDVQEREVRTWITQLRVLLSQLIGI